jgi:hypothetical protein
MLVLTNKYTLKKRVATLKRNGRVFLFPVFIIYLLNMKTNISRIQNFELKITTSIFKFQSIFNPDNLDIDALSSIISTIYLSTLYISTTQSTAVDSNAQSIESSTRFN